MKYFILAITVPPILTVAALLLGANAIGVTLCAVVFGIAWGRQCAIWETQKDSSN